jgi:hypothetical protein
VPLFDGACEVLVEPGFAGCEVEPADWLEPALSRPAAEFWFDWPAAGADWLDWFGCDVDWLGCDPDWFGCEEGEDGAVEDGGLCDADGSAEFLEGALFGDCANAAVASARPIAVVANRRIFIALSCFNGCTGTTTPACSARFPPSGKTGSAGRKTATSIGFPILVEALEIFERLDHHQFEIAPAVLAKLSNEPIEHCAPFVTLPDIIVHHAIDVPRPFQGQFR